jgi:hypothetical protein
MGGTCRGNGCFPYTYTGITASGGVKRFAVIARPHNLSLLTLTCGFDGNHWVFPACSGRFPRPVTA